MIQTSQRRRVVVTSPGLVEIVTELVPELGTNEALVSLKVAGVCGSDVHGAQGSHPTITLPYYPGHEVVGIVQAVGAAVTDLDIGSLVTPQPTLPCGTCKMCRNGKENICENLEFFGCGFPEGGMADLFLIRADRLRLIPQSFNLKQAALIEPLATPVHAVALTDNVRGAKVVIFGCGTIGLLTLAAARHAGAAQIIMTDIRETKRVRALTLGADAVVDASSPDAEVSVRAALGESADVVFDCVAIEFTVNSAVRLVERGGTVVVVGVPAGPIQVPLERIQDRQIRLQGAATYTLEDYEAAIALIAAGKVDAQEFITSTYRLADAAGAFAAAAGGEEVKVLITADDVDPR